MNYSQFFSYFDLFPATVFCFKSAQYFAWSALGPQLTTPDIKD